MLKLYAVRNRDGQWFHRKGYGGYGPCWREGVENATLYHRLGQARSRVTFFTKAYPEFGAPDIVEFDVSEVGAMAGERARAEQAAEKRRKREAEMERRRSEWRNAEHACKCGRVHSEAR